ncbi:hypothetical protein RvY_01610 [Ramazzottius varieornatus]|uniref:Uncharacterized protein n=1 Tax=Ramazzottius varieornatus TaxID=947166 RepID=A0A1D1UHS2_RAMVA|nr:hypothetical protein RvY_01610 [Ramazzottius varieornatus]
MRRRGMFWLQLFKSAHPRVYAVIDRCLVLFVLLPCIVSFWAGLWMLLDLHLYPNDVPLSAWLCVAGGSIVMILFNFIQFELTARFLEPRFSFRNIVVKRLYTLVAAGANVFFCRGLWMVQDYYFGITTPSATFSFVFGASFLVILRASCNGISSPLGTAFDEHKSFFLIQTRFRATADRPLFLLADSVFSVAVVGALVIFEWRGLWVLLDLNLYPGKPTESILWCLSVGYLICIGVDVFQNQAAAVSAFLQEKRYWWLRLAFEDAFLIMAKMGVIAVWRGIWMFCDIVVANRDGPDQEARVWIPILVGYFTSTLLLHGNSLFVLEVVVDGGMTEGEGCRVDITMLEHYLKLWHSTRKPSGNTDGYVRNGKSSPMIVQKPEETIIESTDSGIDVDAAKENHIPFDNFDKRSYMLDDILVC